MESLSYITYSYTDIACHNFTACVRHGNYSGFQFSRLNGNLESAPTAHLIQSKLIIFKLEYVGYLRKR